MSMAKQLAWLAGLSVGALVLAACEEEVVEQPEVVRAIRAVQVGNAEAISGEWLPGRAKATQEVELSFEVAGKMIERPVFVGDEVEQAQVVANLDDRDYRNDLAKAEAEKERAQAQLERVEAAAQTGAVAEQDVTDARAEFNLAEAELRIATKALEDTVIKAPFDGTVAWTYVERYEDVEAKQPILRVVDTSRIEFIVNLPESYMPYMPFVHDLRVQFDSFPDVVVPAQIKEIATEASETTRTYALNLIMDQPEGMKILPGMAGKATGDVTLPETAPEEGIIVPVSAVYSPLGEQSYVWVIDEQAGTVSRREVVTQGLRDTGIPVMEGLQAGEWIATAGVSFLKEGQKVRIVEPEGS